MTKQIIFCDDEIAILRAAEYKLSGAGFDVRCANNGEDACARDRAPLAGPCGHRLADAAARRLRPLPPHSRESAHPHLPVIMLTAKGFELSPAESTEKYGLAKLMIKPFSPRELLRNVEQILGSSCEPSIVASSVNCHSPVGNSTAAN